MQQEPRWNSRDLLYRLEMATNKSGYDYANWVAYAVERYVQTGRASVEFEHALSLYALSHTDFDGMICYCTKSRNGMSDDGIMKSVKKYLKIKEYDYV